MKGDKKVLEHLQTALTMELTAVRQYLLHTHVLADWSLDKLSAKMRMEMHEELGHADQFITRMMFLNGEPELACDQPVARSATLKEMLEADLKDEYEARTFYTKASDVAHSAGDIGSRDLFAAVALDEEGHIDWLEGQLDLLKRMGEVGYMQMYVMPDGASE
jgi:bacterioferritin